MSNQTSLHFDPTALLIIKNEVDNSILQVETAVNSLVEDQTLPFGIEDHLIQFEQCAQVLALIDMQLLAQIAQYSAELMRKIMQDPANVNHQYVVALSDGTSILKRYIEFVCLHETKIAPILLATLNRLEMNLGKPLTHEGDYLHAQLAHGLPNSSFMLQKVQGQIEHAHHLYKLSLKHVLKQPSQFDLKAMQMVGHCVAQHSQAQPSAQYWHWVAIVLQHFDEVRLDDPRLRSLIQIERHLAKYIAQPDQFQTSSTDFADILNICLAQENSYAEELASQLDCPQRISDQQVQHFSRHLYGPDFQTMHAISELVNSDLTQVRNDIEHSYQSIEPEKIEEIQLKLREISNVYTVLNLPENAEQLSTVANTLSTESLRDDQFAQNLLNTLESALNKMGVLERNHTSCRLQLHANNSNVSLDRLDEAYDALLVETKILVDLSSQALVHYLQNPDMMLLEPIAAQLSEIGGALIFLNAHQGQQALDQAAQFVKNHVGKTDKIEETAVHAILDTIASADMLIENLRNRQPVMSSMFDVALRSSATLQIVA